MYCYKYPHPAVTADCIVFNKEDDKVNVLLIKRKNEPYKDCWAFPGGFINIDESAEDAAIRELKEETGLVVSEVEQLKAYSNPDRDPRERIITIAFIAESKIKDVKGSDDAKEARWFDISNLPDLAFDHSEILRDALMKLGNRGGNILVSEIINCNRNVAGTKENWKVSSPKYGKGKGKMMTYANCFDPHKQAFISWEGDLPHWQQEGVMQFITFRLADSLPQSKLKEFKEEKTEWLNTHPKPWSIEEIEEYQDIFEKIDEWLDQGYGECILKYKEIQDIVENALKHFDGERYELFDYIIMSNHVHLLMIPGTGYELKEILRSIKGFTGNKINKVLKREGPIWEKESWDRLIRSIGDYESKVEYIKHNGDYK